MSQCCVGLRVGESGKTLIEYVLPSFQSARVVLCAADPLRLEGKQLRKNVCKGRDEGSLTCVVDYEVWIEASDSFLRLTFPMFYEVILPIKRLLIGVIFISSPPRDRGKRPQFGRGVVEKGGQGKGSQSLDGS